MNELNDDHLHHLMRDAVRAGVRDAVEELLADESRFGRLSEKLYGKLEHHARQNLAQWIGQRVIMILATTVLGAAIAWAFVTGRIK